MGQCSLAMHRRVRPSNLETCPFRVPDTGCAPQLGGIRYRSSWQSGLHQNVSAVLGRVRQRDCRLVILRALGLVSYIGRDLWPFIRLH
jgi:hypothetical protein